jgi:hypothetical protein
MAVAAAVMPGADSCCCCVKERPAVMGETNRHEGLNNGDVGNMRSRARSHNGTRRWRANCYSYCCLPTPHHADNVMRSPSQTRSVAICCFHAATLLPNE